MTERRRERIFHPLIHSPNSQNDQSWGDLKPRASFEFPVWVQGLKILSHPRVLSQTIHRIALVSLTALLNGRIQFKELGKCTWLSSCHHRLALEHFTTWKGGKHHSAPTSVWWIAWNWFTLYKYVFFCKKEKYPTPFFFSVISQFYPWFQQPRVAAFQQPMVICILSEKLFFSSRISYKWKF